MSIAVFVICILMPSVTGPMASVCAFSSSFSYCLRCFWAFLFHQAAPSMKASTARSSPAASVCAHFRAARPSCSFNTFFSVGMMFLGLMNN